MVITATEFKANIGYYLGIVSEQDVFITKNGKMVAKLTSPTENKQAILDSLVGAAARNSSGNPSDNEEQKKKR